VVAVVGDKNCPVLGKSGSDLRSQGLEAGARGEASKGIDLHRNRLLDPKVRRELGVVGDHHEAAGADFYQLLAEEGRAMALDAVEPGRDLVGAVDSEIEVSQLVESTQRDAQLFRLGMGLQGGRRADHPQSIANTSPQVVNEPLGGRTRPQPQFHVIFDQFQRPQGRRFLCSLGIAHESKARQLARLVWSYLSQVFTGIVEEIGKFAALTTQGRNRTLRVKASLVLGDLKIGDSVAHDGVCLTVERILADGYEVSAIDETLNVTALGDRRVGDDLNLERALPAGGRMGGHWVQGHIDGVAVIEAMASRGGSTEWTLRLPPGLPRYCVDRGSICLDGTSLTVAKVQGDRIRVNLIPHTQGASVAGSWKTGRRVNVEVDILAKYVERLLETKGKS